MTRWDDPVYVDLLCLAACVGLALATMGDVFVAGAILLGYLTGFRVRRWWTY